MNAAYVGWMVLAIASGVLVSRKTQSDLPLSRGQKFAILWGAFCGAMIGAKLPFVLADWPGFLSGSAWFSDGKTIVLGLVGGYFGVVLAKWALDIHVPTGDSFVLPVAIAVATRSPRQPTFTAPSAIFRPILDAAALGQVFGATLARETRCRAARIGARGPPW